MTPSDDLHRDNPRISSKQTIDPNDPDARERQRTMDVDLAMQMSRARRGSASLPIPIRQQSHTSNALLSASPLRSSPEQGFLHLSPHEEEAINTARSGGTAGEEDNHEVVSNLLHAPEEDPYDASDDMRSFSIMHPHLSQGHDPDLLFSLNQTSRPELEHNDTSSMLPMYQPVYRSNFDYSHMEEFGTEEKRRLGIGLSSRQKPLLPRSQDVRRTLPPPFESREQVGDEAAEEPLPDRESSSEFARLRQRKLSQSNAPPATRRGKGGKLALFEGNINAGAPPPSLLPPTSTLFPGTQNDGPYAAGPSGWSLGPSHGQGHDRPYRFSFYSNALSATIHARSLCELPADGQTFEELFAGKRRSEEDVRASQTETGGPANAAKHARGIINQTSPQRNLRGGTPIPIADGGLGPAPDRKGRKPDSAMEDGWEGNTWWLDILNPTDDEMRMLSKVFSIHPLTTEDIQMEEAREKIELFRNYYLVCFRSFDQDQYSPTYLEPVNMYIIVFREGTLSFHFRPTPHPQNVRRRITQLKDYISVTSDWISYALIDDITDAFGPLIQSIEYEVDSIDELVLILKEAEQSDMLRRIGTCRKKVMGLLRLMGNKADVVKGLAKRCNENWSVAPKSDIGLYLSDIQDHLITMTQNLNHYEKILSRSHSNYLAQISIEMTDANNQINDVLSKLTALGTVLIPMNLITGLWGMNVHVPGQDIQTGYTWFLSIIGVLVSIAIVGSFLTYRLMVSR
ncbi:cora-domain-containing protein [Ramaria rubella]|nr:cora-domain-containing protein [Ramaria rubella]